MSLFIAELAFGRVNATHLVEAKAGVMFTSIFAALCGVAVLLVATRKAKA